MTLIIGVKCGDGIVIGGDTIVTYGSPATYSAIEQEIASKITIEKNDVIVAYSGAVGMSQLVKERLFTKWDAIKMQEVGPARHEISRQLWSEVEPALQRAHAMAQLVGAQALDSIWFNFLVTLPLNDKSELLCFDEQAQSEMVTADVPFVAIGSGQAIALPFLAFVKRVIWKDLMPKTIGDGISGVLWTLQHVIKVNAGLGVGGEPTIAALQKQQGVWKAQMLDDYSLDEHKQAIRAAESALSNYQNIFNPSTVNED